jgi:hypothetical protein
MQNKDTQKDTEKDTKIDLDGCFLKSDHMVGRRVMDEYILVPLARSTVELDAIFRLNPVGAFIWEQFDGHTPCRDIIRRLVDEFDVRENQASSDFQLFVAQLESIQAVSLSNTHAPGGHNER